MPLALTSESTLADVRTALGDAARSAIEMRSTPADKRGDTFDADLKAAVADIHFANDLEVALAAEERGRLAKIEADAAAERAKGPRAAFRDKDVPRTAGWELVEDEAYKAFATGERGAFDIEVRNLLSESGGAPGIGSGVNLFQPVAQPYFKPGPQQQRLFVRDLLGAQPTGLSHIPYMQEKTPLTYEGGAQMTSEGSAKAEVTMEFQDADAPVRKITAWIPVTTEILTDAPTLRGYIDNRLAYMIMFREEQQILKGTGVAPQILGITNTVGTQTQTAVAGDVPATFAAAYGKLENVDGNVTGVVMNPLDYWGAVATRHATQFDNGFGGNAPAEIASISWGQPVIRSRSMAAGESLVGDWRGGASLFQREGVNIRTSDSHDDFFVKNKVAIVGEERVALAVEHPPFFVETAIDLTAP